MNGGGYMVIATVHVMVEVQLFGLKMTMKLFLYHILYLPINRAPPNQTKNTRIYFVRLGGDLKFYDKEKKRRC